MLISFIGTIRTIRTDSRSVLALNIALRNWVIVAVALRLHLGRSGLLEGVIILMPCYIASSPYICLTSCRSNFWSDSCHCQARCCGGFMFQRALADVGGGESGGRASPENIRLTRHLARFPSKHTHYGSHQSIENRYGAQPQPL